ncbi:ROK family protein [Stieleria sp. TO1_6]|uniref:ROK family protein n=1 Tax=Stieleria tagensis TaxID=2956795 RepID=UPI00209B584D|nr:ROK family protein [Stieleria tagensis]MCO8124328.1 ROK family protein [Stieleria tagensis]
MISTVNHVDDSDTPAPDSDAYVMGIDLGGTSVKLGILRGDTLISRGRFSTAQCKTPTDVFRQAKSFATEKLNAVDASVNDLHSVGLAMAGVIDESTATLKETANLHSWHGIGFRQELIQVFERPVAVINDANAAALGEAFHGRHRTESLALLTLGTGIGGGIIVGGRPVNGSHGCGGEIGHVTIDHSPDARPCGCGRAGHLEAYAGAAGIVMTATEQLDNSDHPSCLRILPRLSPQTIATAAEQGDQVAIETVRRTAVHLGRAIAMLAQIADPSVVLLGGAVTFGGLETKTGRDFLKTIHQETVRLSLVQAGSGLEIDFATLGNDAGMLGAARHASQTACEHDFDRNSESRHED